MNDYEGLVLQLELKGEMPEKQAAVEALRAAGERAKPALLSGLDHPAWRVRHGCLLLLDHTVVDDETRLRVVRALHDPHRKVRRAAIHLLGCERCKPEGFCGIEGVDIDAVYLDAAASDRSRRVRYAAMGRFMWQLQPLEPRVASTMQAVIDEDADADLRRRAAHVLAFPDVYGSSASRSDRQEQMRERVDALLT
jgi:hypothetical protein